MLSPWRLVAVLTLGLALPAQADECLTKIDTMVVVYALAPSPDFAAAYPSNESPNMRVLSSPLGGEAAAPAAPETTAPPASQAGGYGEVRGTLHQQPRAAPGQELPPELAAGSASVPQLPPATRRQLQETLYAARDAEAEGNEARCEELLAKAQQTLPSRRGPPPRIQ
jgi:hypothetical protein